MPDNFVLQYKLSRAVKSTIRHVPGMVRSCFSHEARTAKCGAARRGSGQGQVTREYLARRSGERSGERSSEPALYYISCTHRPHYALYGTVGGGGLAGGVIRRRRGERSGGGWSEGGIRLSP